MKLPVLLAAAAGCLPDRVQPCPDGRHTVRHFRDCRSRRHSDARGHACHIGRACLAEVGTIPPETADAGRSYVDETLFIGDSNTARYLLYANETGTAFTSLNNNIGVVSMGVGSITS